MSRRRIFLSWVKDAFSHYWGGPKLTESPLIDLQIVQDSVGENEGVPANALRPVLRDAMEHMKPEGGSQIHARVDAV